MARHPAPRLPLAVFALVVAGGIVSAAMRRMQPVKVAGRSMLPSLGPGDMLAITPPPVVVARGDVIVVTAGERDVVKRAVAVAGDRYQGVVIPDGHVFAAGDNPRESTDSRSYGPISLDLIQGVARFVYWPPWRWTLL